MAVYLHRMGLADPQLTFTLFVAATLSSYGNKQKNTSCFSRKRKSSMACEKCYHLLYRYFIFTWENGDGLHRPQHAKGSQDLSGADLTL